MKLVHFIFAHVIMTINESIVLINGQSIIYNHLDPFAVSPKPKPKYASVFIVKRLIFWNYILYVFWD